MKKTLGIIGKKLGMTQIFLEDGSVVPATIVEAGPCKVVQKKTQEREGYTALQIGFGRRSPKHTTKGLAGHFQKVEDRYQSASEIIRDLSLYKGKTPKTSEIDDIMLRIKAREQKTTALCWNCRRPLPPKSRACPHCGESV